MTTILVIIFATAFTWFTAKIDSEYWDSAKDRYILNHTSRFIQRAIYCLTMAIFSYKQCAISAMTFWLFFDQFLNIQKGLPLFYLGSTARTDIWFAKTIWVYLSAKFLDLTLLVCILLEPDFLTTIINYVKSFF